MTAKPVRLRELARRDVEEAVDFYAREAGERTALRYVEALERVLAAVGAHPAAGSSRFGYELDLPGLRSRAVGRFPYLVFYVETPEHVDVWRVLHAARDIPVWLSGSA
jgi:toxin ParE1/3/4